MTTLIISKKHQLDVRSKVALLDRVFGEDFCYIVVDDNHFVALDLPEYPKMRGIKIEPLLERGELETY